VPFLIRVPVRRVYPEPAFEQFWNPEHLTLHRFGCYGSQIETIDNLTGGNIVWPTTRNYWGSPQLKMPMDTFMYSPSGPIPLEYGATSLTSTFYLILTTSVAFRLIGPAFQD
jgi:hypothetical protein